MARERHGRGTLARDLRLRLTGIAMLVVAALSLSRASLWLRIDRGHAPSVAAFCLVLVAVVFGILGMVMATLGRHIHDRRER